ncbi:MAG: hypothetical protein NWF10_04810 [Candidatus Bathyarchaeota archaeon]|nr:hypothetical protein [Candidatus Bathyarchaeota archaeon]
MIESGAFNVLLNKPYTVYLGVADRMGDFEYYKVYVKLRNQSQAVQETSAGLPSPLEPIFEYHLFLRNNETWEKDFVFSFEDVLFGEKVGRVSRLSISGSDVSVDKIVVWDEARGGFQCQILFELWIYNATISDFQYHNRSVWFWLNLIETL